MADEGPKKTRRLERRLQERRSEPEDAALSPDSGRPGARRRPSTSKPAKSPAKPACGGDAAPEPRAAEEAAAAETGVRERAAPKPQADLASDFAAPISPWVIAPVSGAVAAALVIGVGWMLGWPAGSAGRPHAASQCGRRRRADRARRGRSRPKPASPQRPRPIRPRSRGSRRWKNRRPRCAMNSPRRARNRKNSPPISAASNRRRATPRSRGRSVRASTRVSTQIESAAQRNDDRAGECQSRRMMRRCAASWWHRCSIFRCGRANRSRRRLTAAKVAGARCRGAEIAGGLCRHRRADRGHLEPRAADAGAEIVAAGAGK